MALGKAELLYAMNLPPAQAVAFFERKGLVITENWYDLLGEVHNRAFTVAQVAKLNVLQDIRDAMLSAMEAGQTFSEFKKGLQPLLEQKGWWGQAIDSETGEILKTYPGTNRPVRYGDPQRLKLIYDVNLQNAFMAGRRERQLSNIDDRPYWQYVAVMDSKTRPSHRALNGRVFRYDDPFWQSFYPPNGYRCRCRVRALSSDEVGMGSGQTPQSSSRGRLSWVNVPLSKTNPAAGTTNMRRFEYAPGQHVATDAGWSHAPDVAPHPDLSRYHADLVVAYRKAVKP